MATSAFGRNLGKLVGMVKEHTAIIPLVAACMFSGSMGISMMTYTSLRKSDVIFDRWRKSQAYPPLKSTPDEKLYVVDFAKDSYRKCNNDPLQHLLDDIYDDGRYDPKRK